MKQAMIKNGEYVAAYGKAGYSDCLRAAGFIVALGDSWEEYLTEVPLSELGVTLIPMDEPASHDHIKPVIVAGRLTWDLNNE